MGGFNILGTLGKVAGGVAKTAFPWAGALGALGSLGSSILGNTGSFKRQKYSDRQNIAFWNMQNKYNHPLQQMQRLQEAGLNPNLIYGQSVAGATGQADQVAPSKAAPYSIQNPVPSAINSIVGSQQAKLMQAQSINQIAQSTKYGAETAKLKGLLSSEISSAQSKAGMDKIKLQVQSATKESQIKQIVATANLTELKGELQTIQNTLAKKGYVPGNTIGTIFNNILGLDLNTQDGLWKARTIVLAIGGTQLLKNLGQAFPNFLKKPPKTSIKNKTHFQGDQLIYK
jgi:hypothetical protein